MNSSQFRSTPPLRLAIPVILATINPAMAGPPMIAQVTMNGVHPQLSITSDLGVTNQIQTTTSLAQGSWVLLGSLVVTQSPYGNGAGTGPEITRATRKPIRMAPTPAQPASTEAATGIIMPSIAGIRIALAIR